MFQVLKELEVCKEGTWEIASKSMAGEVGFGPLVSLDLVSKSRYGGRCLSVSVQELIDGSALNKAAAPSHTQSSYKLVLI
jgi:hypothetical protein